MSRMRIALLVSAATGLTLGAPLPAMAQPLTSPATGRGVAPAVPVPAPVVPGVTNAVSPQRSDASAPRQSGGRPLVGVFRLASGQCGSGKPTGSYFTMLDPSGNPVSNSDSPCSDKSATPLRAGATGLSTQGFQPFPSNPGASNAIAQPATFFGSPFTVATQSPDKQSGRAVSAPSVSDNGGALTGHLEAFQVYYNGAYYNQGSPKPGGASPGRTTATATGRYDPSTGHYSLDWKSTITGGAFNNFTGVWHFEGTFAPAGSGAITNSGGGGASGAASGSASATATSPTASTTSSGSTGAGASSLPMTGPSRSPVLPFALLLPVLVGAWVIRWRRAGAEA